MDFYSLEYVEKLNSKHRKPREKSESIEMVIKALVFEKFKLVFKKVFKKLYLNQHPDLELEILSNFIKELIPLSYNTK